MGSVALARMPVAVRELELDLDAFDRNVVVATPSTLVAPLVAFHANRQLQGLWQSRFDCGPLGRRDA